MKTIIKKSVLVALMLGTFSCYATKSTFTKKKKTEVEMVFDNVKKGQYWYIKNAEGKILHQEEIKNTGSYTKSFDFTSLKNGYYTLEINKDFHIEVSPFTVVSKVATFYKEATKTIFKPVIRTDENNLMISKLNFESTPLEVIIYFEGKIIFKETVSGSANLGRIYKLKKDIKGFYKVVLKANDRRYTNEFSL